MIINIEGVDVVDALAAGTDAAAGDAAHQLVIRDHDIDSDDRKAGRKAELGQGAVEKACLVERARVAIKDVAAGSVGLL